MNQVNYHLRKDLVLIHLCQIFALRITFGIINLFKGFNVYKASGPDLMSTKFLKETAKVIAPVNFQSLTKFW